MRLKASARVVSGCAARAAHLPKRRFYSAQADSLVNERDPGQPRKGLQDAFIERNASSKTIETAIGPLPLSPLMDPAHHEARARWRQPKVPEKKTAEKQKWQRHLERNPYALALATPCRRCHITNTAMPMEFLQRFNVVSHMETDQPWWFPGDLEDTKKKPLTSHEEVLKTAEEEAPETVSKEKSSKPARRPVGQSVWMVPRMDLMRKFRDPRSAWKGAQKRIGILMMASPRTADSAKNAHFHEKMDEILLSWMRQFIIDRLVYYAQLDAKGEREYVRQLETWDEVKNLKHRGCLLWLGRDRAEGIVEENRESEAHDVSVLDKKSDPRMGPPRLSTMDIEGVKFGKKLAVHNLNLLLGKEHLSRLRDEVPVFGKGSLFLLGRVRTLDVQRRLWKLQGFLYSSEAEHDKKT